MAVNINLLGWRAYAVSSPFTSSSLWTTRISGTANKFCAGYMKSPCLIDYGLFDEADVISKTLKENKLMVDDKRHRGW